MRKLIHMMAAIYTFVCPKCRLILQFEINIIPKCPKCGCIMLKK
jgi:NAD-dependent SIR2 family protein deacetylase